MGKEQEIFDTLTRLCVSPGYVHAIAYLCFKHNMVFYREKMTSEDMRPSYSPDRLIRTEISTLIGLLVKRDIDYVLPDPLALRRYIDETETLLKELHHFMSAVEVQEQNPESDPENVFKQFGTGEILRSLIFYSGESAYSFQYRALTARKYGKDNEWFEATKGFSIESVRDVVYAIQKIQDEKLTKIRARYSDKRPLPILAGYMFTVHEVAGRINMDASAVEKILTAFTVSSEDHNATFQMLNDFNVANAAPLIRYNDDSFILFQQFSLVEAMYESPFYWMCQDDKYKAQADDNRGKFTEEFCRERLEFVFGKENVYPNVKIIDSKKDLGEIDVLVLFGDRAIVLQAKSKRLTLEARKGNDGQIREDFKKSIQDSYDQGYRDAELLSNGKYRFINSESNEIGIPNRIKEIYILCVVSDPYPSLNFQAQAFLQFKKTAVIHPPLIMNVFTLDAMTEMLQSPLWLLSYINRRVNYFDRLLASNELVILSEHIKNNLWLEDEDTPRYLFDDIASDLEVAMTARREGFPGDRTPDGFLKRFKTTTLGRIFKTIEASPTPATIDLGFMLLTLAEDTVTAISRGIDRIMALAKKDGKAHDCTIGVSAGSTGLTIHSNYDPAHIATKKLQVHCTMRKYTQQANTWFGVWIHPENVTLMFGVSLNYRWEQRADIEAEARWFLKSQ